MIQEISTANYRGECQSIVSHRGESRVLCMQGVLEAVQDGYCYDRDIFIFSLIKLP